MWAPNDTGDAKLMCRKKLQVGRFFGGGGQSIHRGQLPPCPNVATCLFTPRLGLRLRYICRA